MQEVKIENTDSAQVDTDRSSGKPQNRSYSVPKKAIGDGNVTFKDFSNEMVSIPNRSGTRSNDSWR